MFESWITPWDESGDPDQHPNFMVGAGGLERVSASGKDLRHRLEGRGDAERIPACRLCPGEPEQDQGPQRGLRCCAASFAGHSRMKAGAKLSLLVTGGTASLASCKPLSN